MLEEAADETNDRNESERAARKEPAQARILVGLDVLEESTESLKEALAFATLIPKTHVEVVWIPSLAYLAADLNPEETPTATLTSRVQEVIEEFGRSRLAAAEIQISVMVGEGSPAESLSRIAFMHGADMIVVGSHDRRSKIEEFFLGSVAKKLVREAPCPVLVMRPRVSEAVPTVDAPLRGKQAERHAGPPHHYHYASRNVTARENMPLLFPMGNP